jgi:hypothetical protein
MELGDESLQLERLCDAFSAELLMPRRWVANRYHGGEEGFETLKDLSDAAGVSFSAAFIRLSSVLHWSSTLFFIRREDFACSAVGGALQLADVQLAPASVDALCGHLPRRASRRRKDIEPQFARVEMRLGTDSYRLGCEVLPTRSGVWFIADVPRPDPMRRFGITTDLWLDPGLG